MSRVTIRYFTLALAPLVLALSLAMDVYVPAIPEMTKFFNASDSKILLTLSLFMLSAGLMQLFIGPISDSLGRKSVAYWMTVVFAIGCLSCALAPNATFLIAARIIQALGSCGLMVLGFAMVRDCYHGDESAKIYSRLNGVISFSPMFAPFIGSQLELAFGWQATFLSLLVIALLNALSLFFLIPETLTKKDRQPLRLKQTFAQYKIIFFNRQFFIFNLASCFGLAYLYLFCALSPYLIIRNLGIPVAAYGFYFFYMGLSFFLGSIICSFIVMRLGMYKTCIAGFIITLCGGTWMVVWQSLFGLTLYGFIYPMLLIGIGGTFCLGSGSGGAMAPFGQISGTAAALGGAMRFLFSSFAGMLFIHNTVSTTLPLGVPAVAFSVTGLLLFAYLKRAPQLHQQRAT